MRYLARLLGDLSPPIVRICNISVRKRTLQCGYADLYPYAEPYLLVPSVCSFLISFSRSLGPSPSDLSFSEWTTTAASALCVAASRARACTASSSPTSPTSATYADSPAQVPPSSSPAGQLDSLPMADIQPKPPKK